ncbi:hypothetical protein ACFFQF_06790 [Haladaptatus pallidirubidus]|uniref:ArsR family transcriptional regulator n=1 Tax=Haladaptatus pallidirubidus TaxID=1008152 RepID=A0AAV3UMZ7_9EURY|nr:hypothetical protein [Haladaptatus pallidirubidus]
MELSKSTRLNAVFNALSDSERRRVIHYLTKTSDGTATVDELATLGNDFAGNEVRLRHIHLPHLDGTKLIEYDERTETVRYRDHPFFEDILDHCLENDPVL